MAAMVFKFEFIPYVSYYTKVRKVTTITNRYNQVPHLTQDTTWESDKNTCTICDKSFDEFQYGHHDGYFENKNVSISANRIFCWPGTSHDFSSI